jgi:hypothetical protein
MQALAPGGRTPSPSRTRGLIGALAVAFLLIGAVQAMSPASAAAMIREETQEECEAAGGTWWDPGFGPAACIKFDDDSGGGGLDEGGPGVCLVSDSDEGTNCVEPPPFDEDTEVTPIHNPAEFPAMPYFDEDESPPPPTIVIARGSGEIRTTPARKSTRNAKKAKARNRGRVRH